MVKFEAKISKDGTIQALKLVSGPPLLVQAAMQAVQTWVYKPTMLNGEPVEVLTTIDVNFTLSQWYSGSFTSSPTVILVLKNQLAGD